MQSDINTETPQEPNRTDMDNVPQIENNHDPAQAKNKPKKSRKKLMIIVLLSLLFIVALSAAVYALTGQSDSDKNATDSPAATNQTTNEPQQVAIDAVVYDEKELTNRKMDADNNPLDIIKHSIYSMDLNGEKKLIYSFTEDQQKYNDQTLPEVRLTDNQKVFIYDRHNPYALINKFGKNVTASDDLYFKDDNLTFNNPLVSKDGSLIVYTLDEVKGNPKHLYIKNTETNKTESVEINIESTYDSPAMGSIHLAGWSKDGKSVYVKFAGYEYVQDNKLWRVNLANKSVTPINSVTNISTSNLTVSSKTDIALSVEGETATAFMSQYIKAPTKLTLIDLSKDTARQIAQSADNVIENPYLSSDGKHVIYQEYKVTTSTSEYGMQEVSKKLVTTKILNLSDSTIKNIDLKQRIIYTSPDLQTVLTTNDDDSSGKQQLSLYDTDNGHIIATLANSSANTYDWKTGDKMYEYIGSFTAN